MEPDSLCITAGPQHMHAAAVQDKTHADALSHYWVSRQTEEQGNCPQEMTLLGLCQIV